MTSVDIFLREFSVVFLFHISHNLLSLLFLFKGLVMFATCLLTWLLPLLAPLRFGFRWRWSITYVLQVFVCCELWFLLLELFFRNYVERSRSRWLFWYSLRISRSWMGSVSLWAQQLVHRVARLVPHLGDTWEWTERSTSRFSFISLSAPVCCVGHRVVQILPSGDRLQIESLIRFIVMLG